MDVERGDIASALTSGRCDLATSLAIRRDFVAKPLLSFPATAYVSVPLSILVRDGDRPRVAAGLCGLRVGVFAGTREADLLRELSAACAQRNLQSIRPVDVQDTPTALERLSAGGLDALLAEHPVNDWFARRQTDRYDVAWILADEVVHWALGNRPRMDAVTGALHGELLRMHHDGALAELLERWGLRRTGAVPLPIT